jgi:transglutaminase-like putative cysteine protease
VRLSVAHRTVLTYEQPIAETHMEVRLRPRSGAGQAVERFQLTVEPRSPVRSYRDGFGNHVHYFNHVPGHDRVAVLAESVVTTAAGLPDLEDREFPQDFLQFRSPVLDAAGVGALAGRFQGGDVERRLEDLVLHVNREFEYQPDTTTVYTAVDEVLRRRAGVCQDFAHLFIAVARCMGLPARYVSGYIHSGVGHVGEGASHAWAEVLVPGVGWVGYDPTNPVRALERHLRVAIGRDYRDVAPTRGTYLGTAHENMEVSVTTSELAAP